jgi:hypothetical protein
MARVLSGPVKSRGVLFLFFVFVPYPWSMVISHTVTGIFYFQATILANNCSSVLMLSKVVFGLGATRAERLRSRF